MTGWDAASLAATALATSPAPTGSPHDAHRLPPATWATVRRPPGRQDEPIARCRDRAPSGHDEAQAPQAGQAEASKFSTIAPSSWRPGAEIAPVGQAVRQARHAEQRATSMTTSPSGATDETNCQGPVCSASADIARTVAPGS